MWNRIIEISETKLAKSVWFACLIENTSISVFCLNVPKKLYLFFPDKQLLARFFIILCYILVIGCEYLIFRKTLMGKLSNFKLHLFFYNKFSVSFWAIVSAYHAHIVNWISWILDRENKKLSKALFFKIP